MERISREQINLLIAQVVSKRGTCQRLQVGCVITTPDGRLISSGYNGPLKDEDHCTESFCDTDKPCIRAVHAEANAIYSAAKQGIMLRNAVLYLTHSPCNDCVEAIVQAGISKIYFITLFRDDIPLYRLMRNGVQVIQLDPTTGEESLWLGR